MLCHNVTCMPLALHVVTLMSRVIDPRYQVEDVSGLHVLSNQMPGLLTAVTVTSLLSFTIQYNRV